MNQITHWLDGSNIYGSNERDMQKLRRGIHGQLKITRQRSSRHGSLPSCSLERSSDRIGMCRGCSSCFFAGDARANEQLNLIVLHTVWMREHNRVANKLRKLNPSWFDDKVFNEARRITIAEYQHIVYKEWLPIILGGEFMTSFGLWPLSKGYSDTYRDDFDPRITNEFATAGFRFGHSLIPSTFDRVRRTSSGRSLANKLDTREMFFKPGSMKSQAALLDDLARGLTSQEGEIWDNNFVKDITDHLFESRAGQGGLDLVALNIQRGRDHGLPGYNAYREICGSGSGRASDWQDLEDIIPKHQVDQLKSLYKSVDDVDLFVGGFLELPHRDSILGPTFKCIVGDQFARFNYRLQFQPFRVPFKSTLSRLKLGDRFFYDLNVDSNISFSEDQLQEIRKTSMARILCDNVDSITRIQPQAFRYVIHHNLSKLCCHWTLFCRTANSANNKIQSCNSINIPAVNLRPFRESRRSFGRR